MMKKTLRTYALAYGMICVTLAGSITAQAQVIQIGQTAGAIPQVNLPNPFPDAFEASRQQYLLLASELTAAGMLPGEVTGVRFYVSFAGATGLLENYSLAMGHTTASSLSNTAWETLADRVDVTSLPGFSVINPSAIPPVVSNWQGPDFPSTAPFVWDGVRNIVVEVCHGTANALTSATNSTSATIWFRTTSFNSSRSMAQNDVATGCGATNLTGANGTQTNRPLMQLMVRPKCIATGNIAISNIKPRSADITWLPSVTPKVPQDVRYDVRVDQSEDAPLPGDPYYTTYNLTHDAGTPTVKNMSDGTPLIPETQYYVHVRTRCRNSPDPTSDWVTEPFTTIPDCVPPTVTVDQITSTTAVGSWAAVPTAYDYEYAVSVNTTPPTDGYHTTSTSVLLPGLSTSTFYHLFVRAHCSPTPESRWTRYDFQTLKTTSVADVYADGFVINAYPNPAKDQLSVTVSDAVGHAVVELSDVTGKVVRNVVCIGKSAKIDLSGLAAGMYVVKYKDQLHTQTLKVSKQ